MHQLERRMRRSRRERAPYPHILLVLAGLAFLAWWYRGPSERPEATAHASIPVLHVSQPSAQPLTHPGTPAPSPNYVAVASAVASAPAGGISPEEVVADVADCRRLCGADCEISEAGALVCPRRCQGHDDCGAGQLCTAADFDGAGGRVLRCLASECESSADCAVGTACQLRSSHGRSIGRCELAGQRGFGEQCSPIADADPGPKCGPGLRCSFGYCVPDACGSAAECPAGYTCARFAGSERRACAPHCESDSECPVGEACVATGLGSRCATVAEQSCLTTGCDAGEFCHEESNAAWSLEATCRRSCTPGIANACGAGELCIPSNWGQRGEHPYHCARNCAVEGVLCPEAYECVVEAPGRGVCRFDYRGEIE